MLFWKAVDYISSFFYFKEKAKVRQSKNFLNKIFNYSVASCCSYAMLHHHIKFNTITENKIRVKNIVFVFTPMSY